MRKLYVGLFVSLDGVAESPGRFVPPYFDEQVGAEVDAGMAATDTVLLGRRLYEEWSAYWPRSASSRRSRCRPASCRSRTGGPTAPGASDRLSDGHERRSPRAAPRRSWSRARRVWVCRRGSGSLPSP